MVTLLEPVDSSSWKGAGAPATGLAGAAAGVATTAGLAVPAGVAEGLPAAAGLLGTVLAAGDALTTAVPEPALVTGVAAGRTALGAPGRLGLTVMRAVSLGGALLTTEVPDLGLVSIGGVVGVVARGLSGEGAPDGTPGVTGLMGETGEMPPGVTGLIGLTGEGAAAPGAGLATGWTGESGGVDGLAGGT